MSGISSELPTTLSGLQEQLLLGTLLGDGSMRFTSRHAAFASLHGWKQHAYNQVKGRILSEFVTEPPKRMKNAGYGKWCSRFSTRSSQVFEPIVALCYRPHPTRCYARTGRPIMVKTVNPAWLARIDQIGFLEAIAWWYMDDGSRQGPISSPSITWNTQGFTESENELLAEWLTNHGYASVVRPVRSRRYNTAYHVVATHVEPAVRLLRQLEPFIVPTMAYKTMMARVDTQICTYCQQEFELTVGQIKSPDKQPVNPCCSRPECQAQRHRDTCDRYISQPGKRDEYNCRHREAYAAGGDAARTAAAEYACKYRKENRAKYLHYRWKRRQQQAAARPDPICQRCQQAFKKAGPKASQYCPACRVIVTKEIKRRHEALKRTGPATKICLECKQAFQVTSNGQKFCTPECKRLFVNRHRNQKYQHAVREAKTCEECQTVFIPTGNRQKFCTPECMKIALARRRAHPAASCGTI